MLAWMNFAVLLAASILFLYYYVRSASPAGREKIIGPRAYQLCFYNRLAAGAFEFVITANYILYYFFPLPTPLPNRFPWDWWISLAIAFLLHSPFLVLFSFIYFPIFIVICYAEEQDLLLRYGDAYAEYCKRTGAFWPKRS